jgi:hypothetical protein
MTGSGSPSKRWSPSHHLPCPSLFQDERLRILGDVLQHLDVSQVAGVAAPSSGTTPPGGRPGTTETMKEVDDRSATASPRGGVESSVVGTRSTAMQVNTIRREARTSLRGTGEVVAMEPSGAIAHEPSHGGLCVVSRVVGGSRSGRRCAREDGNGEISELQTGHAMA